MWFDNLKRALRKGFRQLLPHLMMAMLLVLAMAPGVGEITSLMFKTYFRFIIDGSYLWAPVAAAVLLGADMLVNSWLGSLKKPWLEKSLFKTKGNIIFEPIKSGWLSWVYIGLLVLCVPMLAFVEELLFRELASYLGIVALLFISGPVFGLVHYTSGATVRSCIRITGTGLVLAGVYLASGLVGVFMLHTSYNFIVMAWVIYELKFKPLWGPQVELVKEASV